MCFLRNLCFLCLSNDKKFISQRNLCPTIREIFGYILPEYAFQISKTPNLCDNCLNNLENIYNFRRKCLESIRTYKEYLQKFKHDNESSKYLSLEIIDNPYNQTCEISKDIPNAAKIKSEICLDEEIKSEISETDYSNSATGNNEQMPEKFEMVEINVKTEINEQYVVEDSEDSNPFEKEMPNNSEFHNMKNTKNKDGHSPSNDSTEIESEDEFPNTPPEVLQEAALASKKLIPSKSKSRYHKNYDLFLKWKNDKKVTRISENVILAYISEMSKLKTPATVWCEFSMLKSVCKIRENVDIGSYKKVIAFLKQNSKGYTSKKSQILTEEECLKFLSEAPNKDFLMMKVLLIMGLYGSCRGVEITNMTIDDITDSGSIWTILIPKTKHYEQRKFVIPNAVNGGINPTEIIKLYLACRPRDVPHRRLFIRYKNGQCTRQPVGKNTISKIPCQIAKYLQLPNPALYTGHCFRRSSATIVANSGIDILSLKSHRGLKSTKNMAEGYENSSGYSQNPIGIKIWEESRLDMEMSTSSNDISDKDLLNDNDNQDFNNTFS